MFLTHSCIRFYKLKKKMDTLQIDMDEVSKSINIEHISDMNTESNEIISASQI